MAARRPAVSKKKTPSKTVHFIEEGLGIVIASLVMIVAAPVFVHAFTGDTASAQSTTTDLSSVLSAITDLNSQVAALSAQISTLSTTSGYGFSASTTDPTVTAPGMGACLSVCRTTEAACLKKIPANAVPATKVAANGIPLVSKQDTVCKTASDTCVLACKPQAPTVSCETRCAVDLGACIRAAGTNSAAAANCRIRDQLCLAAACLPQTMGSVIVRASHIPPQSCNNQCALESQICLQNATEDTSAIADCQGVTNTCQQTVCAGTPEPIGQAVLDVCENNCTATFQVCSKTAAGDKTALATCNSSYGVCRDNCRQIAGGTTEPFSATGTNPGTDLPTGSGASAPPVISGVVESSVSSTSATVSWITNELTTSVFRYGLTTNYGTSVSSGSYMAHYVNLTGLTPGTTYDYCISATDAGGNSSQACGRSFTTAPK